MTGLVYKEWKQNRWYILSMIICGAAPLLAFLLLKGEITGAAENKLRIGGLIAGFLAAGALQMMVLRGDDRKLWGYWVTATPEGYRGFIRVKYEMIFAMIVLFFTAVQFIDDLFCAFAADRGMEGIIPVSGIALPLVFLQILLRAIDIPFVLRFGSKKGSMIKLIGIVGFTLLLSVLILANPGDIDVVLYDFVTSLVSGERASQLASALLVLMLAAYYISYRISCRLYLKGVEDYDK